MKNGSEKISQRDPFEKGKTKDICQEKYTKICKPISGLDKVGSKK